MKPEGVLPDAVRTLPLEQKIQRLKRLVPEKVAAIEVLVTAALEDEWRKEFHAGPRGGLRVKAVPFVKGGA